jgi:hypothetical protein
LVDRTPEAKYCWKGAHSNKVVPAEALTKTLVELVIIIKTLDFSVISAESAARGLNEVSHQVGDGRGIKQGTAEGDDWHFFSNTDLGSNKIWNSGKK